MQVWAAMNVAMMLWWLAAVGIVPIAGVVSIMVISAAFQVYLFGSAVLLSLHWTDGSWGWLP